MQRKITPDTVHSIFKSQGERNRSRKGFVKFGKVASILHCYHDPRFSKEKLKSLISELEASNKIRPSWWNWLRRLVNKKWRDNGA